MLMLHYETNPTEILRIKLITETVTQKNEI